MFRAMPENEKPPVPRGDHYYLKGGKRSRRTEKDEISGELVWENSENREKKGEVTEKER